MPLRDGDTEGRGEVHPEDARGPAHDLHREVRCPVRCWKAPRRRGAGHRLLEDGLDEGELGAKALGLDEGRPAEEHLEVHAVQFHGDRRQPLCLNLQGPLLQTGRQGRRRRWRQCRRGAAAAFRRRAGTTCCIDLGQCLLQGCKALPPLEVGAQSSLLGNPARGLQVALSVEEVKVCRHVIALQLYSHATAAAIAAAGRHHGEELLCLLDAVLTEQVVAESQPVFLIQGLRLADERPQQGVVALAELLVEDRGRPSCLAQAVGPLVDERVILQVRQAGIDGPRGDELGLEEGAQTSVQLRLCGQQLRASLGVAMAEAVAPDGAVEEAALPQHPDGLPVEGFLAQQWVQLAKGEPLLAAQEVGVSQEAEGRGIAGLGHIREGLDLRGAQGADDVVRHGR
mmetsp:Transcript_157824/g.506162  ORF Transcript_157824/g.506162 Transcript_157824/m.506162 type:complete len:398 (-) Transcript_157824:4297-5490(-)